MGFDIRVVDTWVLPGRRRSRRRGGGTAGGSGAKDRDRYEDVRPVLGILYVLFFLYLVFTFVMLTFSLNFVCVRRLETAEERYSTPDDGFRETEIEKKTFFVVYSLRTHEVVKLLVVDGRGESLGVSGDVVVLVSPFLLYIHFLS